MWLSNPWLRTHNMASNSLLITSKPKSKIKQNTGIAPKLLNVFMLATLNGAYFSSNWPLTLGLVVGSQVWCLWSGSHLGGWWELVLSGWSHWPGWLVRSPAWRVPSPGCVVSAPGYGSSRVTPGASYARPLHGESFSVVVVSVHLQKFIKVLHWGQHHSTGWPRIMDVSFIITLSFTFIHQPRI